MCTNLSRLLRYVNMEQRPVFTFFASLVNVAQTRDLIHVQIRPKKKLKWHFLHICYPCKHRVKAVFTIFALFINVVQTRHLIYVQIWPK